MKILQITLQRLTDMTNEDRLDFQKTLSELNDLINNNASQEELDGCFDLLLEIVDDDPEKYELTKIQMPSKKSPELQKWINYISKKVKEKRIEKGISLGVLSMNSGLSKDVLEKLEKGEHLPSHKTLQLIANSLKISVDELYPNISQLKSKQ